MSAEEMKSDAREREEAAALMDHHAMIADSYARTARKNAASFRAYPSPGCSAEAMEAVAADREAEGGRFRLAAAALRGSGSCAVLHPSFQEEDVLTVASFIVGFWPGLEDGIAWGTDEGPDNPVHQAALRILDRTPSSTENPHE